MANNLNSNTTTKLLKAFLPSFESSLVLSKTVDRKIIGDGQFEPSSGSTVNVKRPHDYNEIETAGGDISSSTKSDIISGYATATVQNYLTVATEWTNYQEALQLDQLSEILAPAGARLAKSVEKRLGQYMYKNCNLHYGTPGTAIDAWTDVANAGALMDSVGVPSDNERFYVMNPYSSTALASAQSGLNGGDSLIKSAWEKAQIPQNFGGLRALTSNALPTYTSGTLSAGANRAGTINGTPTVTYVAHKDTMIQSIPVTGLGAGADTIKAGEIVEITGRYRLNLSTRDAFVDGAGSQVKWSGVVTEDVTLTAGAGTLSVAGPAIYEATGQYNTCDSALTSGDVITILNAAASTIYQPAMFYHRSAFGLCTVDLPKLPSLENTVVNQDGFSIRCVKYADGDTNKAMIRFDVLPAFATYNPFFAGQGFGV